MCYLCYAQRSPICCALSLPLAGCQSGDGTIGNRKKFNKVPESAFLIPRRTPTLEAFLPDPLYLFLEANTNLRPHGKKKRAANPRPARHQSASYAAKLSCYRHVVSDLIWISPKPHFSTLQQLRKSTLRSDNAYAQTLAKCGRLHGPLFTWRTRQSSAASRPWINHAECEYLPQEKPCDCVCVWERQKVTSYVTAGTEFPGNLLEEASELFPVAVATCSGAPVIRCPCNRRGVQEKKN